MSTCQHVLYQAQWKLKLTFMGIWMMSALTVQATVRDMYAKKDLGLFTGNFTAVVPDHGVVALKLTPSK